ncbi:interferon-induced very large GTPase 1-like isoform X1 [Numida meleagris]|uniref:interferon-induced very large GTPase 1-like isoform X1 n=1 Tax=Numida meleagris TaxID=8996 RepID=UPI000B3D9536|nr:interferon-induced very large GTPase 1-like isoform X1 [Numida meleagris]XP_021246462.1 interferon-induced very large GTPase 1-like isoform X1 [Numida meleagris]
MESQEERTDDLEKANLAKRRLAETFQKEGLDEEYWLPKLLKVLGIKSKEALQHLQYEDYLKLECEVRYPWEKTALRKLLHITDNKATVEELQKQRLEMMKQRQEEAKLALQELKELHHSHNHSKEMVRQKEEALWQAMDIPREYWALPEKALVDDLASIQKQLEQQEKTVGRSENVSNKEVLRRASGGLALQGIYRTNSLADMLAKREQLIRVPRGFKLAGPEQGSLLERKEFSSSAAEANFTKSMEQLGFSLSVSAKAGFLGFSVEGGVDYSSSSHKEDTHHSRSEQAYICTTAYQYIPLASCYFQKDQLHLSDGALRELHCIEHLLSITQEADRLNVLKSRCASFFSRFGSHVNQGPLHFGGIFWWKASSKGFRAEQQEEIKQRASEALNSFVRASFSSFAGSVGVNLDVSKSRSQASLGRSDRGSSHTMIQLSVTNTGGPSGSDSLAQWKCGLVANNTTWFVIDRGFQLIPVWDIVLSNHSSDFKSAYQLSTSLRAAYESLTNHSVGTVFGEELASAVEDARAFLQHMRTWEVTADERKLLALIDFKQALNEKAKNPSVWINVCLSDKALQEFLLNTVLFCQKSPPENITSIKHLLQFLLDPHIYSVKDFPRASFIMQWIFCTEHTFPKIPSISEVQDLIETLLQMKEHIQEVTYSPATSASAIHEAKIKATLTISLAVYSLLQYLQERAEKDIELIVLLVTTSIGYQVESSTFQHLLGCPEINFMAKEMQTAYDEYQGLKEQDVYRAEAFLLLTGLTITSESGEVSPEQKSERLVFMEDKMKNSWSAEIKDLLKKQNAFKDWEVLESDLQAYISGQLEDTSVHLKKQIIIKDMEDTFQGNLPPSTSKPKSDDSKSKTHRASANPEFLNLLKRLGLESYYPRKMGSEDFHIIHKTSVHGSQPSKESELPFYFLQKLLCVDYSVRYLTCKKQGKPQVTPTPKATEKEPSDSFDDFFSDLDEGAPDSATRESHVHPMDLQMAIFHCANDFMRQYVSSKLAFCQFALPLLVPNPCTSQIEFPLWSLSQIKKSWKAAPKSGEQTKSSSYTNKLIYLAETPIVSFIRIGSSPSSSKSQLLNALLSKQKHDTFFHRHCKGSTKDCFLMKGVVEISWYCPRGSDADSFDGCVAFCNLHGDARDHEPQLSFLQEISAVNVVLISESDQSDKKGRKILHDLWQSQRPLVCLFTERENIAAGRSSQNIRIGIKNRNEAELVGELTKTIRDLLEGSNTRSSLNMCLGTAHQHGFLVDEDAEACVIAKEKANMLVKLLEGEKLSEIKSKLLPLQGKLWYDWCKKDKELTRLQEKRNKSIEHHRSQIECDKSVIRRKQLDKAFPLNQLMKSVLGFLQSQPVNTKKYFLHWMKVFMDDLSSDRLDELKREYHQLWSQILAIRKSNEENNPKTIMMRRLDSLSNEINDSSIGLEHILREVGQIYEALESTNSKEVCFHQLPEIAADLMVSGYPIELMDGDASYVPLQWVAAIFDRLIEKLGDKRVFVLSVLGIQSTGKSTLLNAMFGLQFNVSAGRCTRGAFMQLIKVDEKLQRDVNFDYMLVVDTEGLRAIEMANKQSLNHDNELATFVIGIGNMTLINIFGENPSEMQDVLQIAVQAFLRMKQVKLSPSCLFVHQNVGEITAKEQNMEGQRRLQEKLDEMTVTAAQQEFCDVTCFSDVIRFDVNTHIHYFAHLWEGNPPMAPPNPTYSQNVQELKRKILQAAKKESQGSVLRLSSLKVRISDLWNALRNENFVFSFKNSVEIAAYKKLETSFSQWTWKLRRHILDLQMQLDNKVRNGELEKITTKQLENLVQETSDAITKDVEKFFSEDRDCEILIQWKSSTELKLKELKASLLEETRRKCEKLLELKKNQRRVDERKSKYENELLKKSRELALSLKGQELSEQELRNSFNSLWMTWVAEVSSNAPPLEEVNIDVEIENALLEHFKEPNVDEQIAKFSKHTTFSLDEKKHISTKKALGFIPSNFSESNVSSFQNITDSIIRRVKENIDQKEKDKMDYSPTFIHEILNEVQEGIKTAPSSEKYNFTKDYRIDLSVYLCRMAAPRFKDMHAAFRKANDPAIYLESKREDFFKCFQISCQGATSITTFADFLCSKIAPGLHLAVYDKTALVIAEHMRSEIPDFNGSRAFLEVCILKYLAEEENFEKFKQYLRSPIAFMKCYIQTRVETYCLDQNRRLAMFLNRTLDQYYENIQKAVFASTTAVKDRRDRNNIISLWLDEFCRELGGVLTLPRSDLVGIEHLEITGIEFLNNAMMEALSPLRDHLKDEFARAGLSSFEKQPYKILVEQFPGCKEQCPFCRAVCTNTMPNHDGDHQLVFHRPQVLGNNRWHKTDNLVIDICSSLVASNCTFRTGKDTQIPYKTYRDAGPPYSTWNILPDSSMQKYWKWFVSHFRAQLEELYKGKFHGRGKIPAAWQTITKQEALEELRRAKLT